MNEVYLELPIKTISEANQRDGWRTKARRTKDARGTVRMALTPRLQGAGFFRERLNGEKSRFVVELTRIAPSNGLDDDNLRSSLKAARDGVADSMGYDDRDPRVRWDYAQLRGKDYGVRVRVSKAAG